MQRHSQQGKYEGRFFEVELKIIMTDVWILLINWPMQQESSDNVQPLSVIANLSHFPHKLRPNNNRVLLILLRKMRSCFMVQQREIVWCTVDCLSRSESTA